MSEGESHAEEQTGLLDFWNVAHSHHRCLDVPGMPCPCSQDGRAAFRSAQRQQADGLDAARPPDCSRLALPLHLWIADFDYRLLQEAADLVSDTALLRSQRCGMHLIS